MTPPVVVLTVPPSAPAAPEAASPFDSLPRALLLRVLSLASPDACGLAQLACVSTLWRRLAGKLSPFAESITLHSTNGRCPLSAASAAALRRLTVLPGAGGSAAELGRLPRGVSLRSLRLSSLAGTLSSSTLRELCGPQMQSLRLTGCRLGGGAQSLCAALASLPSLRAVWLDTPRRGADADAVLTVLASRTTLTHVSLTHPPFGANSDPNGPSAHAALATLAASNPLLSVIRVHGVALDRVPHALLSHASLKRLALVDSGASWALPPAAALYERSRNVAPAAAAPGHAAGRGNEPTSRFFLKEIDISGSPRLVSFLPALLAPRCAAVEQAQHRLSVATSLARNDLPSYDDDDDGHFSSFGAPPEPSNGLTVLRIARLMNLPDADAAALLSSPMFRSHNRCSACANPHDDSASEVIHNASPACRLDLDISGCARLGPLFFAALSSPSLCCLRLAALRSSSVPHFTPPALSALAAPPSLLLSTCSHLDFSHCDALSSLLLLSPDVPPPPLRPIAAAAAACGSALTTLIVDGVASFDDEVASSVAFSCRNLAKLSAIGCARLGDAGLCALADGCPRLACLSLGGGGGTMRNNNSVWSPISLARFAPRLTHLRIARRPDIGDDGLVVALGGVCTDTYECGRTMLRNDGARRLRSLSLLSLGGLTDDGLASVAALVPDLRTLTVACCDHPRLTFAPLHRFACLRTFSVPSGSCPHLAAAAVTRALAACGNLCDVRVGTAVAHAVAESGLPVRAPPPPPPQQQQRRQRQQRRAGVEGEPSCDEAQRFSQPIESGEEEEEEEGREWQWRPSPGGAQALS